MNKEEILNASRKENGNKNLAELDVVRRANGCACVVGAIACCVVLVLASIIANVVLYVPWIIYFSMLGTSWFVRALRLKKKSDWILTVSFIILTALALVGFIFRLIGVAV